MCVLLHLLICIALRAHIIVVEALYKINYYYYYYYPLSTDMWPVQAFCFSYMYTFIGNSKEFGHCCFGEEKLTVFQTVDSIMHEKFSWSFCGFVACGFVTPLPSIVHSFVQMIIALCR